jgi:sortase (surface protein transpeptidase)
MGPDFYYDFKKTPSESRGDDLPAQAGLNSEPKFPLGREPWSIGPGEFYPSGVDPVFADSQTYANGESNQPSVDENLKLKPNMARSNNKARKYRYISLTLFVVGLFLVSAAWGPSIFYFAAKRAGIDLNIATIKESIIKNGDPTQKIRLSPSVYQPTVDPKLSEENRIKIASAGINTQINEAETDNYEMALKKGIWRVPDFGDPFDRRLPTILAAHRFGYLAWSIPFRLKNSFYSLPKTRIGDTIELVWRQRKYTYAIYAESEGEEIVNYQADLILYTCKDLESKVRIFKYAKLLEI